jgi:Ca2+-binding RTX toxin-like protein
MSVIASGLLIAGLIAPAPALAAKGRCFGNVITLKGDGGNNTLRGTSGPDVIDGKGGNDKILGKGGDDVICGGNGDDTINGGPGADFLVGGGANDWLIGGGDEDIMLGLLGDDKLDGGPGTNDVAAYGLATQGVTADLTLEQATGEGSDSFIGVESVFGSPFNDVLTGNEVTNGLSGDAGDDLLQGGDDNDILVGGLGDDALDGQLGERDLASYIFSDTAINASLTTDSVTGEGTDTIPGVEGLVGSAFNDTIVGTSAHDLLSGHSGDDQIDGLGGFDVAVFALTPNAVNVNLALGTATGDGTDTLTNFEAIYATEFNDVLVGNAEDNVFYGDYGDDQMTGGAGNDLFFPDLGNDTIAGGTGDLDEVDFFFADAPVNVNIAAGTATGDGNDSWTEVEVISGSEFGDTITGSPGVDRMLGEGGDDTLIGNDGNDLIDGGPGIDSVDGGPGNDLCRNQETEVSCEGTGGPPTHPYREQSRSVGTFQRRRSH